MKKKVLKIFIIILYILLIFAYFYSVTATVTSNFGGKSMTEDASGQKITNIGIGLALLMILILGTKYMLSSAGDRAEIKKHAVAYVVGAIVLFAASGILEILKNFALNATISTAEPE